MKFNRLKSFIAFGFLALFLVGCGSARVLVIDKPAMTSVKSLTLVEGDHKLRLPGDAALVLKQELEKGFFEKQAFKQGEELRIEYTFLQADEGSRFTRWFWGGLGNAGEASLTVQVKYFDKSNVEVGQVQVESHISSGFLGGSFNSAVKKDAKKIVEFTVLNFG